MAKLKPGTIFPTPEEDAAITAAALSDPDALPFTDEEFAKLTPKREHAKLVDKEISAEVSRTINSDQVGASIPHKVVEAMVDGATPVRAWREYLQLTQAEVAARLGINPSSYAEDEASESLTRSTIEKIAVALGISFEHLDV
jgi:DNA-binding XRE family transcriptional regulator